MSDTGGWIGEDIGDSIESYDPVGGVWETVDKLQESRFSMGVVSSENFRIKTSKISISYPYSNFISNFFF